MAKKPPHKYKTAIKKTLLYSSIFKYPLTYFQLLNNLIIEPEEKINHKEFQYELAKLIKKNYVKVENERCYLPGIKQVEWLKRKKISKILIKKNRPVIKILGKIPWVKFIGITGAVAAYNADKDSDIDILVITQKNRVWITRGFFTIILKIILKNYVHKGIDPNIFIDETQLTWPKEGQNVYVANDIARIQPIINKDDMYFKFLKANKWIGKYLGNCKIYEYEDKLREDKYQGEWLFNILDNIAMFMQCKYMSSKKTKEVTLKHFIHFNKNDSTDSILAKYDERVEKL